MNNNKKFLFYEKMNENKYIIYEFSQNIFSKITGNNDHELNQQAYSDFIQNLHSSNNNNPSLLNFLTHLSGFYKTNNTLRANDSNLNEIYLNSSTLLSNCFKNNKLNDNDEIANHIKSNIDQYSDGDINKDPVINHYLSSLESVKDSDLVQLKILTKTENKTVTKYLISNFPKAYYNDMHTWILKQGNSHITISLISNYLNESQIYSAQILQAPSTKLYKYFFLDNYRSSLSRPENSNNNLIRTKYEIWLDLEDKEYYKTSFKYCVYGLENSIYEYYHTDEDMHYLNKYLQDMNIILIEKPTAPLLNLVEPTSFPEIFYLNKYTYIGMNFQYTDLNGNIKEEIGVFPNIHTYEIYSDCPFDIMRSGYLDERKDKETISNVFGYPDRITLNPLVTTGNLIEQKFNKYNLDDISKKLSSNQYSMFYDYKNPINKTVICMYFYNYEKNTLNLKKSFYGFIDDSFGSDSTDSLNILFKSYKLEYIDKVLKLKNIPYYKKEAYETEINLKTMELVDFIATSHQKVEYVALFDKNDNDIDVILENNNEFFNSYLENLENVIHDKYKFIYLYKASGLYNIKIPFYIKNENKIHISEYHFFNESECNLVKNEILNNVTFFEKYNFNDIDSLIRAKNTKYVYILKTFDAMMFELWEPACPENFDGLSSVRAKYSFRMIKRKYAIPKNKDIQKDDMYKKMIERFQNNAFRETKDLIMQLGFNVLGAQIESGKNSMDEFISGSLNDNFFVLTEKPEERFAFLWLEPSEDYKTGQIYIIDPGLDLASTTNPVGKNSYNNIVNIIYFYYRMFEGMGLYGVFACGDHSYISSIKKPKLIKDLIYKIERMMQASTPSYISDNWQSLCPYYDKLEKKYGHILNIASHLNNTCKLWASNIHRPSEIYESLKDKQYRDSFPATRYDVWLETKNIRYIPYGEQKNLSMGTIDSVNNLYATGHHGLCSSIAYDYEHIFQISENNLSSISGKEVTVYSEPLKKYSDEILCLELYAMSEFQSANCAIFFPY
jgi:hypothetical protein